MRSTCAEMGWYPIPLQHLLGSLHQHCWSPLFGAWMTRKIRAARDNGSLLNSLEQRLIHEWLNNAASIFHVSLVRSPPHTTNIKCLVPRFARVATPDSAVINLLPYISLILCVRQTDQIPRTESPR